MRKAEWDYINSTINEELQTLLEVHQIQETGQHRGITTKTRSSTGHQQQRESRNIDKTVPISLHQRYISQYAKHHKASKKLDSNTNNQRKGGRRSIQESKPFKSIGAWQYIPNRVLNSTYIHNYVLTFNRLVQCKHFLHIQERGQTCSRKLSASISNISTMQAIRTHHL